MGLRVCEEFGLTSATNFALATDSIGMSKKSYALRNRVVETLGVTIA
jgi:hypothetical protein